MHVVLLLYWIAVFVVVVFFFFNNMVMMISPSSSHHNISQLNKNRSRTIEINGKWGVLWDFMLFYFSFLFLCFIRRTTKKQFGGPFLKMIRGKRRIVFLCNIKKMVIRYVKLEPPSAAVRINEEEEEWSQPLMHSSSDYAEREVSNPYCKH